MDDEPIHLMTVFENYMLDNALPPSRFGAEAVNDPRFVFDLGSGRTLRPGMIAEALAFIGIHLFDEPAAPDAAELNRRAERRRRRIAHLEAVLMRLRQEHVDLPDWRLAA